MKITFERLCEIFRVRDDRQLRVNLFGKVSIIDNETVRITNRGLIKLFKELENDTVITLSEAAALYNEKEPTLQFLAVHGHIDYFKLAEGKKGSKILFQRSKLDEFFMTNIKLIKKERNMPEKRELELLIIQGCLYNQEIWKDIMIDFYVNMMSTEAIAAKHDMTSQTVRMKLRLGSNALSKNFISMMQSQNDIANYRDMVHKLESELQMYKSLMHKADAPIKLEGPVELLSRPIEDFRYEMSVRLYGCLTVNMCCKNIQDIINFRKEQIYKYRNVGHTTVMELTVFLAKYKLYLKP